ncbi:RNA polymerase sigma factor [Streptomyces sp. NBC_00038]|uniref:RNA polymerase sigma factor n=1 Tax=Streptomyces sp. NBC_00038 TaxID=2903615 RepID=UPI0022583B81|nr:sigma-70 family RNA polymerase sigma factor [Streptomyces sp. NBC_00038]MCX5554451.1 sigma-70 family RNA polymerase sigma factor [Streptomyces sp. NBC_00038]
MSAVTVFLMHQGASVYEAADAAHEAMAKLLPDLWQTLEHPRTWLRVTAQRCYWRQNNVRASPADPVPDRPGSTCPLTEAVFSEFQQSVLGALRQLPPTMRTVMAWDIDGFGYAEIADELGLTVGAVRQNISRARRRLISLLDLDKGDAHA